MRRAVAGLIAAGLMLIVPLGTAASAGCDDVKVKVLGAKVCGV